MRNPEQEIDLSLFDEMEDQEVIGYVEGKYSKEIAYAILYQVNNLI